MIQVYSAGVGPKICFVNEIATGDFKVIDLHVATSVNHEGNSVRHGGPVCVATAF